MNNSLPNNNRPASLANGAFNPGQRRIGLTGGIATGKTTVTNYLAQTHQLPVLDADLYARQVVLPGSPALRAIAQRYGQKILLPEGGLNRPCLGEIIFADGQERQWLEQLIHPQVRQCFLQGLKELSGEPTVVLAIPLLLEANFADLATEIWVVACDPPQQIERLQQRDGLTPAAAQARIASQMPLGEKIAQAQVVLDNNGSVTELQTQIDRALRTKAPC